MSFIAKPGMGKTTILFELLNQLGSSARTVFLFQTLCSPNELLRSLLRDLGIVDVDADAGRMLEQLIDVLVAEAHKERRVVVVIDEAQNLEDAALELLRMLSNFETPSYKLIQIILAGQPQLREKLASPHLLQLRQRMSIFARLHPFTVEETRLYMRHRLQVAGYDFRTPLFTPPAEALIARYSEGIPRIINNICFNALSLGCVLKQRSIREEVVRESLDDLDLSTESADDSVEEPAVRKRVAFSGSEYRAVSHQPSAWWKRIALCVVLVLQILSFTGGQQSLVAAGSHSLTAVASASEVGIIQPTSAPRTDPRSSLGVQVTRPPIPDPTSSGHR
jgi:general secretion pathway protein A